MFVNPKVAIEKGWIRGIKDQKVQVQPNAIDFTLDKVFSQSANITAVISENSKIMRPLQEFHADALGYWRLEGQKVYDGMSNVYVEVPEGMAAVLYTRSTFARNGVFIMSGLFDAGFKGNVGFTIYTIGGPIDIAPGTRIGQIAFILAPSAGVYAGGYNHKEGEHYSSALTPAQQLEQATKLGIDGGGRPAGRQTFL